MNTKQDIERMALLDILNDELDYANSPEGREEWMGDGYSPNDLDDYVSYKFVIERLMEFIASHRYESVDDALGDFEDTMYDYYASENPESKFKELFREGVSYAQDLWEFIWNEREEI